jgi:hypothetical protein
MAVFFFPPRERGRGGGIENNFPAGFNLDFLQRQDMITAVYFWFQIRTTFR